MTDGLDRFLGHARSFLPEEDRERVSISTTHRYKGLEQDAVIILDGIEGSYPLIHPSWVFTRVFGDTFTEIEAAERRLFYVAVTRARQSLVILTEQRRSSPYLADIESGEHLAAIDWAELPAVSVGGEPRVEVRVYDAYEARDQLRAWATAGTPSTGTGRGRWLPTGSTPSFCSARSGRHERGGWLSSASQARRCSTVGCPGRLPPPARPAAWRRGRTERYASGPACAPTGGPGRRRGAGSRRARLGRGAAATPARCGTRGRRRKGRGWWASHHRRGLPRPPRYGSSAPQAGQWRNGATLARSTIVADAATASRASAVMHHPTGENPRKREKPGRGNTVAGRGLAGSTSPYWLPHPRSTHPSSSCRSDTAPTCSRCRTAHRRPQAGRRGRRSGRRQRERGGRGRGTSCRVRHARHGARGR